MSRRPSTAPIKPAYNYLRHVARVNVRAGSHVHFFTGGRCMCQLADELRRNHNGIGSVFLYLGHDGDNVCVLKDSDGKDVGRGESSQSLFDAVQRAKADWLDRTGWTSVNIEHLAEAASPITRVFTLAAVTTACGKTLSMSPEPARVRTLINASKRIVKLATPDTYFLLPAGLTH